MGDSIDLPEQLPSSKNDKCNDVTRSKTLRKTSKDYTFQRQSNEKHGNIPGCLQHSYLFESTLGEQVPLDPGQGLVGVVISLLHQAQLLPLLLVQPDSHRVLLLQALQGQDEQLGVVLVAEGGEGDGGELARLQPVHRGGVCIPHGRSPTLLFSSSSTVGEEHNSSSPPTKQLWKRAEMELGSGM